jgi:hypothetical protein
MTDGARFTCAGRPIALSGATFYPALLGGARAWHQARFHSYIDGIGSLARSAGLNLLRTTDFWDRATSGQHWDDPTLWRNVDHLLDVAAQDGLLVELDLSAFRWLLVSQHQDPFDATRWTAFLDWVGSRYRDRPEVALYSVLGEPPVPLTPAATDGLVAFYRELTDTLARADPGHMIAAGGFNHMAEWDQARRWWQSIWALPNNDVAAFKTYSSVDLDLMPQLADETRRLRKPLLEEEFGMPQSAGDAVSSGVAYNGLRTGRAPFFDEVYREGSSVGVRAFVFWNLGCEVGSRSFEVSPQTPAVWQVVVDHAPERPATEPAACPPA